MTKKYKTVKDKLRSTGFGKGGDPDEDADFNGQSDPKEFIPQTFYDMDEVLGERESVDPQHVLQSSDVALNQDEVGKSALDNEIFEASKKVRSEASSGTSNIPRSQSPNSDSNDDDIAFSRSSWGQKKEGCPKMCYDQQQMQKKGKAHQQMAHKMSSMPLSLSLNRAKKRTSSFWPK